MENITKIIDKFPSPCYVLDKSLLIKNLEVLKEVQDKTRCKIILALKGFAMYSVFPVIKEYLYGTTASSLNEARLAREKFGKEVHLYAPAYSESEFDELAVYSDHISFNSFSQWHRYKDKMGALSRPLRAGIRINPEHSEVEKAIYDPCASGSRLGVRIEQFEGEDLQGITGLHFHTLCELNADSLQRTLEVVEKKFGKYLKDMEWVNFGGGHHITREDYDTELLCRLINDFRKKYDLEIYLEPGEAVVLNAGYLVASVLDIVENDISIAILDTSAASHMPDVLEGPYHPEIIGAGLAGEFAQTYRLGGLTCLAGDVIGDYSFNDSLKVGTRLIFKDMAHYTMVKNNTFNGVNLPSIAVFDPTSNNIQIVKEFGYNDYLNRL
jgi:carboxyaminopropylagmatine decarboxylase